MNYIIKGKFEEIENEFLKLEEERDLLKAENKKLNYKLKNQPLDETEAIKMLEMKNQQLIQELHKMTEERDELKRNVETLKIDCNSYKKMATGLDEQCNKLDDEIIELKKQNEIKKTIDHDELVKEATKPNDLPDISDMTDSEEEDDKKDDKKNNDNHTPAPTYDWKIIKIKTYLKKYNIELDGLNQLQLNKIKRCVNVYYDIGFRETYVNVILEFINSSGYTQQKVQIKK
jgi:chromosome segregation ATPase